MNDDDLYERHHTLSALVGVLLHELRNPLHSATLLIEAMSAKGADTDALRAKLRSQFAKIDAVMSEAMEPIKDLTVDARPQPIEIGAVIADVVDAVREQAALASVTLEARPAVGLSAIADHTLLVRSLAELCLRSIEAIERGGAERRKLAIEASAEDGAVRICVEDHAPPLTELVRKMPFSVAVSGVRLALARALGTVAGASVRLERSDAEATRFVALLKVPPQGA